MEQKVQVITLDNSILKASINTFGAELIELTTKENNVNHLWNGMEWPNTAPILFPIIGNLSSGKYNYQDNEYALSRHGFARHSLFKIREKQEDSVTLELTHSKDTLLIYPFKFQLLIQFHLKGDRLLVNYQINNLDENSLLFSIGSHPAFVHDENAKLLFEKLPTAYTGDNGFVDFKKVLKLDHEPNSLILKNCNFDNGAIYFQNISAQKIQLINTHSILTMSIPDVPFLGIWKKPDCPFICIEPWCGITDEYQDQMTDLETKRGIIKLNKKESFSTRYDLQVKAF